MKKTRFLFLLALSIILLVGCGAEPTQPPEATETVDVSPLPTPTPETVATASPVPALDSSPIVTPAPAPGMGIVTGYLLSGDPPQPRGQVILYLGEVLTTSDGSPVMTRINKATAPKTITDARGQFAFAEVPPGRYALAVDLIINTLVLHHPTQEGDLLIEVKEGEIMDLGELVYADLPSFP